MQLLKSVKAALVVGAMLASGLVMGQGWVNNSPANTKWAVSAPSADASNSLAISCQPQLASSFNNTPGCPPPPDYYFYTTPNPATIPAGQASAGVSIYWYVRPLNSDTAWLYGVSNIDVNYNGTIYPAGSVICLGGGSNPGQGAGSIHSHQVVNLYMSHVSCTAGTIVPSLPSYVASTQVTTTN